MIRTELYKSTIVGLWSLLFIGFMLLFFGGLAILFLSGIEFVKFTNDSALLVGIVYPVVGLLLFIVLHLNARITFVNFEDQTIKIKNFFSMKTVLYDYTNLDGYADFFVKGIYGSYRVIYFVKDKKMINKISGKFFSNVDQIKDALHDLNYLGNLQLTPGTQLKILLNQPVIEAGYRK